MRKDKALLLGSVCAVVALLQTPAAKAEDNAVRGVGGQSTVGENVVLRCVKAPGMDRMENIRSPHPDA